ncbi:ATP-grasp domain-containing protein [Micromonospora cathayae]|uniref:ATP-grasp domain-containing protein n=1 Tax=Micromonospora cathayae TaxID=3028804 RepID=A0ABY7ZID8_9ACTN|nr:hypothetical protein [Micromonospora sp. HUAS 3]WDZ82650.1 hypothetical protein PVK37_19475 [Micromonospora sp. HUAS 3]
MTDRVPSRPRIALATCAAVPDLGPDAELVPALAPFAAADVVVWNDPTVDWSEYDLVLIRSTWDYLADVDAFLRWADEVERHTTLLNPAGIVRWNCDKRYLAELAAAGVPILPTRFVTAADPATAVESAVAGYAATGDVVVKPSRSAGALGAGRFSDPAAAVAHTRVLLDAGQTVLVQPYLSSVDTRWETGVYLVGGVVTHAVRKRGLLRPDAAPATDHSLADSQEVVATTPEPALVDFARRVLAALPVPAPAYARVDIVESADGPLLIELELIEPALFLDLTPGAAGRVVDALRGFVTRATSSTDRVGGPLPRS